MAHPLYTGWWHNLVIVSYAVPPSVAARALASSGLLLSSAQGAGVELDLAVPASPRAQASAEPVAVVSLVAWRMSRVRVLGVPWPGLSSFSSVSLKVAARVGRQGTGSAEARVRRGWLVIAETCSSRLITRLHRRRLDLPTVHGPVAVESKQQARTLGVEFVWGSAQQGSNLLRVVAVKPQNPGPPHTPEAGSMTSWLLERSWTFLPAGRGASASPHVRSAETLSPTPVAYPTPEAVVEVNFATGAGLERFGEPGAPGGIARELGFLTGAKPMSVILAAGGSGPETFRAGAGRGVGGVAAMPPESATGVRWGVRRK